MDWDDLKVFLAVARAESLSRAGKVLKRDAATVGRRVAKLEGDLGQVLFTKSPQGYALTEAGSRLLSHAERAEQAVLSGADELRGQSGQLSGQVRIGATDGCASYILPQVCAQIQRQHPELELQVVALPRVINLSKREADMAITVSPPQAGRVTVQRITDYHLHLAASETYLRHAPRLERLADLRDHPIVGYIQDMIFYPELDFLTKLGIERVQLASNLVAVQQGMVRQGGGVGITHDFILPFAPELRRVLSDQLSITRSFYLVRHEGDARVERFARVAEALAQGIRAEVARLENMVETP
ncbi:transcriptional regulator, LysR family [Aliiroseovarius crassostreae]|uniref:LysR family transcriptional regulator n=1 Tax=Aliiroseovarius crassostreae TaxID=154981 RepID=A0A0P7JPQ1_9RHOB|nr:LysR family transcriptional regulator [Aliiroseovarius crassostreae]KPN63301.1 LysR family transcriptional regulator [Aliiroseovarius crassostreae]SFU41263.1 transcriptional regulator, LysR family [Aliiroseovarius crassostreae]